MAKYLKKKKKSRAAKVLAVLVTVLAVVCAVLICLAVFQGGDQGGTVQNPTDSAGNVTSTQAQETLPEATEPQPIVLSDKLVIHHISSYAGIYMEDGSDEVVSDVMMIVLENTSEDDLQLARIRIAYPDFTAEFEVTNIPSGEKVVALEKNRHPATKEEHLSAQAETVVFYSKAMVLQENRIRITGSNGSLEVENISGEDIAGDIFIYYKNSATDLLYGGITYRVSVKGGLAAGEKTSIIAGHYTVNGSRLLLVDCGA